MGSGICNSPLRHSVRREGSFPRMADSLKGSSRSDRSLIAIVFSLSNGAALGMGRGCDNAPVSKW